MADCRSEAHGIAEAILGVHLVGYDPTREPEPPEDGEDVQMWSERLAWLVLHEPCAAEKLTAMFDAAEEFLATTSIFRQRRESRDAFEKLALAVLTVRMTNAGRVLGEIVTGDEPLVIEDGSGV